jgi:hypothetical protein
MKDLLTKVVVPNSGKKIGYDDKLLLLGSCFADNIGEKFGTHYFQMLSNPYGTLYNPASIAAILSPIANRQSPISNAPIIERGGLWHSMLHHGSFSHSDRNQVLLRCEQSREQLQGALNEASTIVVTFGTAWVYEMNGEVVANCHKIPANRFVRRCMTVQEIVDMWQPIVDSMPTKHWIFTVSPIRHIKDGLHANQVSKAILLQAVDQLGKSYFPSYEIMMDELRDYRFYAEDMVHPSNVAVDYIWQRFLETYMTLETQNEMRTMNKLWRDRHHRFLHPNSEEAKRFEQRTAERIQDLQWLYPWLE